MFVLKQFALFGSLLILFAMPGCSETHHTGVSTGGPSWVSEAENPIAGIDNGIASVTTLTCGPAEGVTVVVWSDLANSDRQAGGATKQRAFVQMNQSDDSGRQISYTAETTDGEVATIVLQGTEFTTTAGNLFLVSTQGKGVRVAQINTTVQDFPNESDKIRQFASDHADVKKFFQAAMPKQEPENTEE